MPTIRLGKVRHLLKDGKASVVKHKPFTIQLQYESKEFTQPIEVCMDAGYQHIGVSVKQESKELVSAQYDLLKLEKERHDDCRTYRRTRRNRLRYRAPRFNNRETPEGWLAPSIQNKADRHIDIINRIVSVCPVTSIVIEVGQFDTQVLQAVQEGLPIPEGIDYQHGDRYGIDTLREAVFQMDGYKCIVCGKSAIKDGAILHAHHMYFWRGQHGDRLSELATVCEKCHTPKNHKPGGKLYGLDKNLPRYNGAAFMNSVKWFVVNSLKDIYGDIVHFTYGAATKGARLELGLPKSHVNDAFSMGSMHPVNRADTEYFVKLRRNSRILETFKDAKYVDTRDGGTKSGSELGCNRTNRREKRNSDKNDRIYRGAKVRAGKRSIRRTRYSTRPGDIVVVNGCKRVVSCIRSLGKEVVFRDKSTANTKLVRHLYHQGAWERKSKIDV